MKHSHLWAFAYVIRLQKLDNPKKKLTDLKFARILYLSTKQK